MWLWHEAKNYRASRVTANPLQVPLFVCMAAMAPLVLTLDKYKRLAQHFVNNIWAKISTSLFYR